MQADAGWCHDSGNGDGDNMSDLICVQYDLAIKPYLHIKSRLSCMAAYYLMLVNSLVG